MDIVLLHYAAPPIVGGVESVMGQHARLMTEAGHRVRIVAGRGEQTDPRIPFIRLPLVDSRQAEVLAVKRHLDEGRVPGEFDPLVARIEAQLLEVVGNADWLIAHNVCSLNKNLPLTAALHQICAAGSRPHFILWQHDLAWTTPRYRSELHDGYPWDLLKTDWPRAVQVVVSKARRQELAELMGVPRERIQVVPNGVEVPRFLKLAKQTQSLVKKMDLLGASPLMLLPVRITPRKNIELALRVLAELRGHFQNAKLVVTGPLGPHNPANGQYFERLVSLRRELHAENAAYFLAEWTEHVLGDDVIADFYRLADLLFFPSREEGFGIPILEAAVAGIPVFCADIASLRELGGSQVNYFSPDDDPVRVATSMKQALEASSPYTLRKRVMRDYACEEIYANRIAPLLASLVTG
jgi:glycosyltransferase involved in cell wall biosynthesis